MGEAFKTKGAKWDLSLRFEDGCYYRLTAIPAQRHTNAAMLASIELAARLRCLARESNADEPSFAAYFRRRELRKAADAVDPRAGSTGTPSTREKESV